MAEPVTVAFTVEPGQVWTDPDGVSWYVKFIDVDRAYLERTVVTDVALRDLVRTHYQPNDRPPQ